MEITLNSINSYWQTDVPDIVMDYIVEDVWCTDHKGKEYNDNLAGNIQYEYILSECRDVVEMYVVEQARLFMGGEYELTDLWVNMAQKHEFNPIHSHGGDLSFVIFVSIPYHIKDEELRFKHCDAPLAGYFGFHYVDNNKVASEYLAVDKTYEQRMFMFPSHLKHSVNPFYTSDHYRITVAGNLIKSS